MDTQKSRTWVEISLGNLDHNYHALRAMLPKGCRLLASVKADGYGHGAVAVAQRLERLGADYLAVASLDEAAELREHGVGLPILILGYTAPARTADLLHLHLTQGVFDPDTALAYSQAAQGLGEPLTVHLMADTGMSRLGLLCDEKNFARTVDEAAGLCTLPNLNWEGIFTHFSDADGSEEYTMLQFSRFMALIAALEARGIKFKIRHCAASAAVLNYPCTHLDMVRPGIALYGHYPHPTCEGRVAGGLKPLLTWKARVASVKDVPAGTAVSYGRTHVLARDSHLAVLTVGYGDGLPRSCSDKLQVWLGGRKVPILGRICMDLCMADVTDVPGVAAGDEAELYGPHVPVEDAAALAGTIQYELLCNVSKRVPRLYVD